MNGWMKGGMVLALELIYLNIIISFSLFGQTRKWIIWNQYLLEADLETRPEATLVSCRHSPAIPCSSIADTLGRPRNWKGLLCLCLFLRLTYTNETVISSLVPHSTYAEPKSGRLELTC